MSKFLMKNKHIQSIGIGKLLTAYEEVREQTMKSGPSIRHILIAVNNHESTVNRLQLAMVVNESESFA